jgi:hypothetical protein
MSAPGTAAVQTPQDKRATASHRARLTFEQWAMGIIIAVLGLGLIICFVAVMYPAAWAKDMGERINSVKDTIVYFISLISVNLGISFTRGAASEHINKVEGQPE